MKSTRVLLVDDHPDSASSMALYLQLNHCRADVTRSGETALVLAAALRPDVVVLDLQLKGMSALDVCRSLRAYEWGRCMQLIAVTGWPSAAVHAAALGAGFDAHFVKPVAPETLLAVIRRHPRAHVC